jgi:hypothetical protein
MHKQTHVLTHSHTSHTRESDLLTVTENSELPFRPYKQRMRSLALIQNYMVLKKPESLAVINEA